MSDNKDPSLSGGSLHEASRQLVTVPVTTYYGSPSTNGGHSKGEPEQGLTLTFVLHALRRWWLVALLSGLVLGTAAGCLIWYMYVPTYRAEAWLEIRDVEWVFPVHEGSQRFVNTQLDLIRSPLVLGPVVSDPEVAALPEIQKRQAPIDWLPQQILAQAKGQSFITISFAGPNPKNAAKIVNAVIKSYDDLRDQEDANRMGRVIDLLRNEQGRRTERLKDLWKDVQNLSIELTGKDPYAAPYVQRQVGPPGSPMVVMPRQTLGAASPLTDLQENLVNTEVNREVLEARIQAYKELTDKQPIKVSDEEVQQRIEQHSEVVERKRNLDESRATLRRYAKILTKGKHDPKYKQLENDIKEIEGSLGQLRIELKPEVEDQTRLELETRRKGQLASMQSELESYQLMEDVLRERYNSERKNVKEYRGETLDLERARDEFALAKSVSDRIRVRIEELETRQRAPARVVPRLSAKAPTIPESTPHKKMIMGIVAAFLFPFGLAILWERMARRVNDARQLERNSQVPVVAEVSRLPTRVFSRASSRRVGRDVRVFQESIDSLRTYLTLSEPLKDVRVLAVTSAANNEGKTSVAVQLAVSTARASGEMALLIDGDMRSPDVHKVLETPLEPGLAEVLSGECSVEDAIITDWSRGKLVHLLPAGKLQGSPHKLVGNGALRLLLEEVRSLYRYVIIDTPPVLAAGEALVFAKAADASLICTMRDVSRFDQINLTHERLVAANARPIGIVLNGVPVKQYAYRYGSYGYTVRPAS